jgi:hypothetical protein
VTAATSTEAKGSVSIRLRTFQAPNRHENHIPTGHPRGSPNQPQPRFAPPEEEISPTASRVRATRTGAGRRHHGASRTPAAPTRNAIANSVAARASPPHGEEARRRRRMGVAGRSVPDGGGREGPPASGGGCERACDGEAPHLSGDGGRRLERSRERERGNRGSV